MVAALTTRLGMECDAAGHGYLSPACSWPLELLDASSNQEAPRGDRKRGKSAGTQRRSACR